MFGENQLYICAKLIVLISVCYNIVVLKYTNVKAFMVSKHIIGM